MQGQQAYSSVSTVIDMESLVPTEHFLRRVNRLLNLSFLRELTKPFYCAGKGRPSIDPELFFRMVLVSYFYNIHSDRQLCEEIQYNLAYRLFCKIPLNQAIPDHSSLSRIRNRLGEEVFQHFFQRIVLLCQAHGLVKGQSLMTDATLIEANASLDSMIPKDQNFTANSDKVNDVADVKQKKFSNKTHISKTDPDASLSHRAGTTQTLKYKTNITVDRAHRIIVDCPVVTGADHESQTYIQRLDHIAATYDWIIEDVTADRAYGSGEILQTLQDKNIKSYIPLFNSNSGNKSAKAFVYEAEHDRYRCPQGKYLLFRLTDRDQRNFYKASIQDCQMCCVKDTCLKTIYQKKNGRMVNRSKYQELYEKISKQMKTSTFVQRLTERFWKMEGLMAEAKNIHGLKRAKYRGLSNVQIQAYLVSTVQNIKRLMATIILLEPLALVVSNKTLIFPTYIFEKLRKR